MKDAIDLIENKLTAQVNMEEIAKRAHSSSFHFQRMFHMLTGVTVAEYIRKRRLTLAVQDLIMTSAKVLDISLKYGYESPESFAKAFRKAHGVSPSDARSQGIKLKAFPRISFHLSLRGDKDVDYKIVNREAFAVVGKMIRVSSTNAENFRRIPQFWDECYADGSVEKLRALRPDGALLGICMDMDHQNDEFTYAIAVEGNVSTAEKGLNRSDIPASSWAVFTSTGALPDAIQDVWKRIFEEWFPATGYQHTGGPELEMLPPGDDLADDYQCEVWIPVVKY